MSVTGQAGVPALVRFVHVVDRDGVDGRLTDMSATHRVEMLQVGSGELIFSGQGDLRGHGCLGFTVKSTSSTGGDSDIDWRNGNNWGLSDNLRVDCCFNFRFCGVGVGGKSIIVRISGSSGICFPGNDTVLSCIEVGAGVLVIFGSSFCYNSGLRGVGGHRASAVCVGKFIKVGSTQSVLCVLVNQSELRADLIVLTQVLHPSERAGLFLVISVVVGESSEREG